VTSAFTSFGTQLVQFQKYEPRFGGPGRPPEVERNRRDLTIADAEALKRLSRLARAVSQERYLFVDSPPVRAGRNEAAGARVFGTNPDYAEANVHFTQDGRFITDADVRLAAKVCVIGPHVADELFPLRDPIGRRLLVGAREYEVVGLFEKKGSAFGGSNDNFVAIPISAFDEQFPQVKNGGGDTIHIATVPRRAEDVDALVEEETAILRARRGLRPGKPNDFAVMTSVGQLRQFQQISGGVAMAMLVIAAIALLVGGVGVMNIMLVNVTQRTREIGVRKAVGATRRDVMQQFLVEAVTLTGIGAVIGLVGGIAVAMVIKAVTPVAASVPAIAIFSALGASCITGILFGMLPAARAAKLDPVVALRYE